MDPAEEGEGEGNATAAVAFPPSAGARSSSAAHDAAAAASTPSIASSRSTRLSERIQQKQARSANASGGEEDERSRKKKKDAPALSSAAAAAAAAPQSRAPVNTLDLDSLSVCFSFLNTRDFLHAIRTCRQWRAARTRKSAWPTLHVPSFLRALCGEEGSRLSRQLTVDSCLKVQGLLRPRCMEMWRNVSELNLERNEEAVSSHRAQEAKLERHLEQLLDRLVDFPCVSALSVVHVPLSRKAITTAVLLLADRLQSLVLQRGSQSRLESDPFDSLDSFHAAWLPLDQLRSLRVLVLDCFPEAAALAQLHQLVYLQMSGAFEAEFEDGEEEVVADGTKVLVPLMRVIRWLSIHHQLRSLSVDIFHDYDADGLPICMKALVEISDAPLADDSFVGALRPPLLLHHPCGLTDVSLHESCNGVGREAAGAAARLLFGGLPHLTQFQCAHNDVEGLPELSTNLLREAPASSLARLHELHIDIHPDAETFDLQARLRPLKACTQLRGLQVRAMDAASKAKTQIVSADLLCALLAVWPSIEEIRFSPDVKLQFRSDLAHAFAACRQLHSLELQLQPSIPADLFAALSTLPHFHTLVFAWRDSQQPTLPPTLLRSMTESPSWSEVRLRPDAHDGFLSSTPAKRLAESGLNKQLAAMKPLNPRVAQRMQVMVYGPLGIEDCFRVDTDAATGKHVWRREYE